MKVISCSPAAYQLMHEGMEALAHVEAAGMRVDVGYLKRTIEDTKGKMTALESKLRGDKVYKTWRKAFGSKTKLGSKEQLGAVLFGVMGYRCANVTPTGRPKVDEAALETVDLPFVKDYLHLMKLQKAKSTYLTGILRESVKSSDGNYYLHPFFNLHTALSYRSSCDHPNFQNMPVRLKWFSELIRKAFIPRPDHDIAEIDYGGIEVKAVEWYSHDPVLLKYIQDPSTDMHRDIACQLFMIDKEEVLKDVRHVAKNKFVFPEFYGSYYVDCARAIWEALLRQKLKAASGFDLREHLAKKGIAKGGRFDPDTEPARGTFEAHVKAVEEDFWGRRFKVHKAWMRSWWEEYQRKGWFQTLTGFVIGGVLRRNQVTNLGAQGSAFHCLLWSLTQLVKAIKKYKMKTRIVGQIHDSIVPDIHRKERQSFLDLCHEVMTVKVKKHWDFINTPMEVEVELSPDGGTWFQKTKYERDGEGLWTKAA